MDYRQVEERATEAVVKWLTDEQPKIGEALWDASLGKRDTLSELTHEEISEAAKYAEPTGERLYFLLQDLCPTGRAFDFIRWDGVAEELREVFQVVPEAGRRRSSRRRVNRV